MSAYLHALIPGLMNSLGPAAAATAAAAGVLDLVLIVIRDEPVVDP